jgi:hypothetical protein
VLACKRAHGSRLRCVETARCRRATPAVRIVPWQPPDHVPSQRQTRVAQLSHARWFPRVSAGASDASHRVLFVPPGVGMPPTMHGHLDTAHAYVRVVLESFACCVHVSPGRVAQHIVQMRLAALPLLPACALRRVRREGTRGGCDL